VPQHGAPLGLDVGAAELVAEVPQQAVLGSLVTAEPAAASRAARGCSRMSGLLSEMGG